MAEIEPAFSREPQTGQCVSSIRLDSDAQLDIRDFAGLIVQKVGEPLDRSKVSQSLKNLFATGRFLDLRADTEVRGSAVELIFVARAVFYSGVVRAEGVPKTLEPKILTDASRLRLGQAVSEDDLVEAKKRVAAALSENGYHQASLNYRLIRHPETQQVDVVFSVSAGPSAKLQRVDFVGHPVIPLATLVKVAGWKPGVQLTSASVERGLFKIHQRYVSRGHLQVALGVLGRDYDPKTQTEILRVNVEAGPLIRVHVEGAEVSNSKLRDLLPFFRDGVVDDDALSRSENILENHFQRQGFFEASVKAARIERSDPQEIEVRFQTALGSREEFAGYSFRGNKSLPSSELGAAMTEKTTGSAPSPSIFSQELLSRHVASLEKLYQWRGFLEARVKAHVEHQADHGRARHSIIFDIDEGPRTKVGKLTIRGLDQKTLNDIWPLLRTKPGDPYAPERAQADRDRILDELSDRGYTRPSASWQASPASLSHEVELEHRIELGPQELIKRVVVMGQEHTRAGIIRRELTLHEGEPLRQSDVLETQRRLYELGVFNQVQIAKQEAQGPEAAETLLVDLEEARRWTVGYGGGIEFQRLSGNQPSGQFQASPRLSLDISRLNVGGRAQTFAIRGQLSNLERGGGMSYLIPRLVARRDLTLRLNALVDRSRDVLTFTADRREGSISVEKRFSPTTLLIGRYQFRRVQALDISTRISAEQIPLFSRPARIGGLGAGYVNDHRDDPTDATRGSYSVADTFVAWGKFGSESNFLRFSGQNSTYRRLGSHIIFARSTRIGVESPFGRIVPGEAAIPLPERFFMGGGESHRGFSINQAGPRDIGTGFPLGGNALFFNSLELRFPLREKRLGLVLFEDAGNVYSTARKLHFLKFTQNSPTDLDYTVHAVGLGVRYKTPVAPVRFDVGYGLNTPHFQILIQHPPGIPATVEVRRLPRLQFFLSIGQSF